MRHIEEFNIHHFRGLQELKLEGLGQINLLVGDNNSGKTSILEALALYCDPLNGRKWADISAEREAGMAGLSVNERIAWLFPQGKGASDATSADVAQQITLSARGKFPVEKVEAYYERFFDAISVRMPELINGEIVYEEKEVASIRVNISALLRDLAPNSLPAGQQRYEERETFVASSIRQPSSVRKNARLVALPTRLINSSSHRLSTTPPQLWTDVVLAEVKAATIELLRFSDQNIRDIDMILSLIERPILSVKHDKLIRAPLSMFGDGLRRIFTMASAVPGAKGGLLLIDELEMSIHTKTLEKSFNWLVNACIQNDVQLFTTTHSLEALDALLQACDQSIDLVVYRLLLNEDHIEITRFDKEELTLLRDELGVDMRW